MPLTVAVQNLGPLGEPILKLLQQYGQNGRLEYEGRVQVIGALSLWYVILGLGRA